LKGVKLKTALNILTIVVLSVLAGCNGAAMQKELLTVDFQQNQRLQYKFVSSRDIEIDWGQPKSRSKPTESNIDKTHESMEMVVDYTPIETDPYGVTTIKATCKSVKVERTSRKARQTARKDPVESLAGKTFTFTVSSAGKIEDYSQLNELIRQIGEKAFRTNSKGIRIKEPDMIDDFVLSQWFLWDSVSSIKDPIKGLSVGQTWKSVLLVPNPMLLRKARDVTYKLDEIRQSEEGRIAVISSSYGPAESVPPSWPKPYSGSFQMSGKFGFLRTVIKNFNVLDLHGQGEELFNLDTGRTLSCNQKYQWQLEAATASLFGAKPLITIKQAFSMQLVR